MNNNIFFNKNNIKSDEKFNPDITNKFTTRSANKNINNIQYTKEIWKGITGNDFNKDIKKSDDFKINFETVNISEIMSKHQQEYDIRTRETTLVNEKNRLIKQSCNTMNLDNIIINTTSNNKTHDELKQIQINDNDILKNEKEKYNAMLKVLDNL